MQSRNLFLLPFRGVNFQFNRPISADKCILRLEQAPRRRLRNKKRKTLLITPLNNHSYEFVLKSWSHNMLPLDFTGQIEEYSPDLASITATAKVSLASWLWLLYAVLWLVITLIYNFYPVTVFWVALVGLYLHKHIRAYYQAEQTLKGIIDSPTL
ncbi:MAG: hypothetical protein H6672_12320 [Anaerolineaceae bacterium]|nr:hypothetical protein [Anaerolineaceae bacterium]